METWDKYAGKAAAWSDEQYADAHRYLAHRARLVRTLGPRLRPGDSVFDLACGDGALGDLLPEQSYLGVDANTEMVAAGRARGRELICADLNDYVPTSPVHATTIFRAIYYAHDRRALFERIAGYTERKLIFDVNPRQYDPAVIRVELAAAGFEAVQMRPFFVPQTRVFPLLTVLERTGPLARFLLRFRFTLLVAASRHAGAS